MLTVTLLSYSPKNERNPLPEHLREGVADPRIEEISGEAGFAEIPLAFGKDD